MSPACLPSSKDNNYENIMVSIDSSFILCLWTLIGFVAQATVSTWASHPSGGKKVVEVNTMTNDQVGWQEIILIFDLILINRLQIYISVHQYRYNKDWRYLSWHALYWRLQFTTFTNLFQHSLCLKIIIFSPTVCVAPLPQSPPPTRPGCARPSLGSCVCGRSSSRTRIVGGTQASKGEFPWQVALVL